MKQILKIFHGDVLLFGITFSGYGVISFLVTDANSSQSITIPYRVITLFLNLFFLLKHFQIIKCGVFSATKNSIALLRKNVVIWPLLTILIAYSFRVLHAVITDPPASLLSQEPSMYLQFWFLISLLPALNFLFLDRAKSENYLFITWLMHAFIGVSILFLDVSSKEIGGAGRLSGAALNPISLGHYSVSLVTTSLFIWLRTQTSLNLLFGKQLAELLL